MQKVHVVDEREGSQVPFLRGILTRSLQKFGVPFEKAHVAATDIRDRISGRDLISTKELRAVVFDYLTKHGLEKEAKAYRDIGSTEPSLHIIDTDGGSIPFSKGRLSQSMEICGFDPETAYQITKAIEVNLALKNRREITTAEIVERTHNAILKLAGKDSAGRYLHWREFSQQGKPLILLVGGTTGTGKSTISSELAHRLDIVRTQSTDMLREVMRLMIPSRLLPALHTSSFEAYKHFPIGMQSVKNLIHRQ